MITSNLSRFSAVVCLLSLALTATLADSASPLLRRYREGEKLSYLMKAVNENRHYEIRADGIVKNDGDGFVEEYAFSNFVLEGKPVAFAPSTLGARLQVTLDPNHNPSVPNLASFDQRIIGPVTDFLTFYVDLWLAVKAGHLVLPGDHFYFQKGTPNSWADGTYTILGEEVIDFDFTLKAVNPTAKTATLLVRHVPPANPQIKIPTEWMRKPVADTANNWVEIQKRSNGKFLAAVGKETFDVTIEVSLADGKILSGTIYNPVNTIEAECDDLALTKCAPPKPHPILRQIEIWLVER